jgi:hypothetical protein
MVRSAATPRVSNHVATGILIQVPVVMLLAFASRTTGELTNNPYLFGSRSKLGTPSGIAWNSCLSMV